MQTRLDNILSADALGAGWKSCLGSEFQKKHMSDLEQYLRSERDAQKQFFPSQQNIFRAFELVDFLDVRVVILGQDPYHGVGQANGLAFAVHAGIAAPPSLRNIFKEISSDMSCPIPRETSLEGWAQQGVLLLNTVLTVRAHDAFSHRNQGWESFTDQAIRALSRRSEPLVFMLWGAPAQRKEALITQSHHLILKAAHPSPLSAHRGFFGCRHFTKANEFLARRGLPIDWQRTEHVEAEG
jgi:uracil-DNA glycosylase